MTGMNKEEANKEGGRIERKGGREDRKEGRGGGNKDMRSKRIKKYEKRQPIPRAR